MPKIPFGFLPGSWGLKGDTRARAELEYYYEGEELDRRLADLDAKSDTTLKIKKHLELDKKYSKISEEQYERRLIELDDNLTETDKSIRQLGLDLKYGKITQEQLDRNMVVLDFNSTSLEKEIKNLDIDKKYNKISEIDYDIRVAELMFASDEKALKLQKLEIAKKYNQIEETEYDKQKATINGEPWVLGKTSFESSLGPGGFSIEYDYNEHFIKMLIDNGYSGTTDIQIVQDWVNDLCKAVAIEEGLMPEDVETLWPATAGRFTKATPGQDGRRTYS